MKKVDLARIAKRLTAMAFKRETYKDKIESHLLGALGEFYKAALAEKNGLTTWNEHWREESRYLIEVAMTSELRHSIRGFKDRRKAFEEACQIIKDGDKSSRTFAENTVKTDYGLRKVKRSLTDQDTARFWSHVYKVAESALRAVNAW